MILRHGRWVFARLLRALLEALDQHLDLVVRRADGDQAIAGSAGALGLDRSRGGDVDRRRGVRQGVEPGAFDVEMLRAVLDDLAGEELLDDLDRLGQPLEPDRRFRPVVADDVLVQRLARAEPEVEPAREHRFECRGGLGDDGRVVAVAGRGDAGAEAQIGGRPERAHPRPDEGRLPLRWAPRGGSGPTPSPL